MNNTLKKILQRIDGIFKNGGSNWSSQRVISIALVFVPLIVWTIISLVTWAVLPIPESVVALIIVGVTGKVYSKKIELQKENTDAK